MNKIRIGLILSLAGVLAFSTGCKTAANGTRTIDIVKVQQAKALIEPVAASALRRVIQRSPEHAPEIAAYASSLAGVFCTMSLSNNFSPEYLIAAADKFADPALANIDHGYLIDVKNAAVGIYKVLWGDRFQAEISETNWLHAVCEFFCESINQGLTDAGYPGGVRKVATGGNRESGEKLNLIAQTKAPIIREPEAGAAASLRTDCQAPPALPISDLRFRIADFRSVTRPGYWVSDGIYREEVLVCREMSDLSLAR